MGTHLKKTHIPKGIIMSFRTISVKKENYKKLREIQIRISQKSEDGSLPSWDEVVSYLLLIEAQR